MARGIKVDTIRGRLAEVGRIESVAPRVTAGGGISFDFHVAAADDRAFLSWRDDGITYEMLPPDAQTLPPAALDASAALPIRPADTAPALTNFVRVDLARLDDLMRLVGDLVVSRARLEDALIRVEPFVPAGEWRTLRDETESIERQLRDLREGVMRVRLVPVAEIFRRMPFVVRDLARDSGRRVQLEMSGQATEIDKFLIERMMDPVLHLVRNAVSHGIETPEERTAAGKRPDGTIRLAASTVGESVVLEVSDDGRGIDTQAIASRARAAGFDIADGEIDSRVLLDVICSPGFSTRDEADRASGRGVGMAVVRDTVQDLGGTLSVETVAGRSTTFSSGVAADAGDYRCAHRPRRRPDLRGTPGRGPGDRRGGRRLAARDREQRVDDASGGGGAGGPAGASVLTRIGAAPAHACDSDRHRRRRRSASWSTASRDSAKSW